MCNDWWKRWSQTSLTPSHPSLSTLATEKKYICDFCLIRLISCSLLLLTWNDGSTRIRIFWVWTPSLFRSTWSYKKSHNTTFVLLFSTQNVATCLVTTCLSARQKFFLSTAQCVASLPLSCNHSNFYCKTNYAQQHETLLLLMQQMWLTLCHFSCCSWCHCCTALWDTVFRLQIFLLAQLTIVMSSFSWEQLLISE